MVLLIIRQSLDKEHTACYSRVNLDINWYLVIFRFVSNFKKKPCFFAKVMDKTSGKRKCNVSKIPGGKHSSLLVVRPKCMKCTSRSQQQEFYNSMGHCGFLVLNVDRTCSYISKMHVLCLITKSQFLNLDHLSWIKFYMLFPKCF